VCVAALDEPLYGVVVAANRAVQNVLEQLGNFCSKRQKTGSLMRQKFMKTPIN